MTPSQRTLVLAMAAIVTCMMSGCGSLSNVAPTSGSSQAATPLLVQAGQTAVQAGSLVTFSVSDPGSPTPSGGVWQVLGGSANGTITPAGVFTAPTSVPSPATVWVMYTLGQQSGTASIMVVAKAQAPPSEDPVSLQVPFRTLSVGSSELLTATQDGKPAQDGQWLVFGGSVNGSIDASGNYTAPAAVPSPAAVTIGYVLGAETVLATITIQNDAPVLTSVTPSATSALKTSIQIQGSGFTAAATLTANGAALPTTFIDANNLSAVLTLPSPTPQTLEIAVAVPNAPASNGIPFTADFPVITVAPAELTGGPVSLIVTGTQFQPGDLITLNAVPLVTSVLSPTQLSATGFLAPWTSGSATVEVVSGDGTSPLAAVPVPITPTAVSYDAAARFATQAAMGPRPDVVMHIQQVGFEGFLNEQFAQPDVTFTGDGQKQFLVAASSGNSLLRQRVSLALQAFIVPQNESFDQSSFFIEEKFENAASGNFRQLMTDIAGDPNITTLLNLPGNQAATSGLVQPNQNFAREFMQLFTLGPFLLNDDGSTQIDGSGNPIPTYQQADVVDLTRALTGWVDPPIVNPQDTAWGIDFSQSLVPVEAFHDRGTKLLFGAVQIPAGQSAEQDRATVLDAIFAHPNLPPFISHLLIQHLVKSNPSPAYIQRISRIFEDDGHGVRGNMQAVVTGILLDSEARAGDTATSSTDGFLQDPLLFQIFAMSALGNTGTDDQPNRYAAALGEPWWYSPTIFGAFSPSYVIPGTSLSGPEFALFNNITLIERSEYLWGMIVGMPGYAAASPSTSWLLGNFTTVSTMIDALNHLLYHGTMTQAQQQLISTYCASLNPFDIQQQLYSAMFLALNGDSYNVSH